MKTIDKELVLLVGTTIREGQYSYGAWCCRHRYFIRAVPKRPPGNSHTEHQNERSSLPPAWLSQWAPVAGRYVGCGDRKLKDIASPWDRPKCLVRLIVECSPDFRHAVGNSVFGDDGVTPDRIKQFIFADQQALPFNQIPEHLE